MHKLIYDFKKYKNYKSYKDIILLYISSKAFQAVCLFRLSNFLYKKGMTKLSVLIKNKSIKKTGCEIGENAEIGKGLRISHPVGIVISGGAKIGENVIVQSGVVIGTNRDEIDKYPQIGNGVYIGAGAKILGDIIVGDNVIIGANSVVIRDIPNNRIVAGIPASEIKII